MLNETIRALRQAARLTQVDLAKAMGVSKQCVSNWENDNIQPSVEMLVRLAQYFRVSTDFFAGAGKGRNDRRGRAERRRDRARTAVGGGPRRKRPLTNEKSAERRHDAAFRAFFLTKGAGKWYNRAERKEGRTLSAGKPC